MSLFKQLALAISLIIITILASVLFINYESSKKQMLESMYQTTVNNISTLSEKIAQAQNDKAVIESIVDAEFSSGYYQSIKYKSYDPNFSYAQEYKDEIVSVPHWFISFTDLKLQSATLEVSSEWNILGELKVSGDNTVIYKSLYQIFTDLLILFVVFVILSFIVLNIMLHFILKPLYKIQLQAEAITNNEFIIEESSPFTTEFKEVSKAINSMVKKVEENFKRANEISKRNHELLYLDQVTKLANKRYFLLKLPETIQLETKTNGGSILTIGLSDAEVLNKRFEREKADQFFFAFAEILQLHTKEFDDTIVARVNGTEFSLVLSGATLKEADSVAHSIYAHFIDLITQYHLSLSEIDINIGIYKYNPSIKTQEVLEHASFSLLEAKADEKNHIYITADNTHETRTKDQWREILEDALTNNKFSLKFWNCIDHRSLEVDHKVMTFTIEDGEHKYFYGDFIPAAIDLGLASQVYMYILEKLFTMKLDTTQTSRYSVRLSNEFLKDYRSFVYLENLFKKYEKETNKQLVFEITNSFCTNNTLLANGYANLFKKYGFGFCINAFTNESSDLNYLKSLSCDLIKLDINFLLDLSSESFNSLVFITNSLNITMVATMVKNDEELQSIEKLGIELFQGPLTDKL